MMELKNLLSIVTAALTSLGAMLFAMGSQSPWLAMSLWMAAVVSLVVTDFLGAVRLPRNLASLAIFGMLFIFAPNFFLQTSWDNRLLAVAGILVVVQVTLLFQEKDSRVYRWLAIMSLLQAVVAARYSSGVGFGLVLIAYTIVGMFDMSLLALYSQWGRHGAWSREQGARSHPKGIPPCSVLPAPCFTSAPAGSGRSGVVRELFARLGLIAFGALLLGGIIFYTTPRVRLSAWRGEGRRALSTVGFNDQISLGGLGETIENPEEVMQLKLFDKATGEVYPLRSEVYLRGSIAAWYSQGNWRRGPPPNSVEADADEAARSRKRHAEAAFRRGENWRQARMEEETNDKVFRIGPPVVQHIAMEPYLEHDDLFFIWPLIEPIHQNSIYYTPGGRLMRVPTFSGEPRPDSLKFDVETSGLVDGHQADLIPASAEILTKPYLRMPHSVTRPGAAGLPRLTALAEQWLREGGVPANNHYNIARLFEQQLSGSGLFQYSLQGAERDASIDPIEDFVSNHRSGHCEYFATALALMLRSQKIPSRVVLGYRCDEWHEREQCFQVRQLHAHAWVEAFLAADQIPQTLRDGNPKCWRNGGWLRLDPTPAGEIGTRAAESTTWGKLKDRWHGLQHFWDNYIVDMDRKRQRESVYDPVSRATSSLKDKLFNRAWWNALAAGLRASLASALQSGIMGWLFGVAVMIAIVILPLAAVWWLARRVVRLWRRFSRGGGKLSAGARSSVEFYHRFEQIAARLGLVRAAGQTPREFARSAGSRLAAASGRRELYVGAVQVVEEFYRVRFGRQELDAAAVETLHKTLEELSAGSHEG
jgi:protein-glutamine gamma-glutamyltransferase